MTRASTTAAVAAQSLPLLLLLFLGALCGGWTKAAHAAAVLSKSQIAVGMQQQGKPADQQPPAPWRSPVLAGYTYNSSRDTFEMCRQNSGLKHMSEKRLLSVFNLPRNLYKYRHINLEKLIQLLHAVQPNFAVIWEPMLFGDADIGQLLSPGGLPKLIHFTVRDKGRLQPHQVLSMASWAHHNPGYSLLLFDDADIHNFMITYYPDLLPTFDALGSPVERADMWRYLVLCRLGGVYADSDVVAAKPVSSWAQDAGLLVGIENVFKTPEEAKKRDYARQIQMVQWTIAARRGHPVVCSMGQYVINHVEQEADGEFLDPDHDHAILERTGPGIWSSSISDYLQKVGGVGPEQLVAGGRIGDVRLLPQPVFGCGAYDFNPADPLPYVYHMFKGSWRQRPSRLQAVEHMLYDMFHHHKQHEEEQTLAAVEALAAAGRTDNSSRGSASAKKHPHLPLLDEQIAEHRRQQQLLDQQQQQQALLTAAVTGRMPRQHQHQQLIRLPAAAGSAAAAGQQLPQSRAGGAKLHLVPGGDGRRLRSSQLLLVPGAADQAAAAVLQPELPSRSLGAMPAVSLLLVAMLLCSYAVKQQQSGASVSWSDSQRPFGLLLARWTASSSSRSAARGSSVIPPPAGSRLSGSRLAYPGSSSVSSNSSSSCMLVLPAAPAAGAAAVLAIAPGGQRVVQATIQTQQDICYASSQHHGNPHRHKRSWGSSSNFAQLERGLH
jgi:hypothetical protein